MARVETPETFWAMDSVSGLESRHGVIEIVIEILNAHKMVNTNYIVLICYAYDDLTSIDYIKYKFETLNSL